MRAKAIAKMTQSYNIVPTHQTNTEVGDSSRHQGEGSMEEGGARGCARGEEHGGGGRTRVNGLWGVGGVGKHLNRLFRRLKNRGTGIDIGGTRG